MIKQNIPLKLYSNFKIGGKAKYFAQASNLQELELIFAKWKEISSGLPEEDKNIFIFGDGTNVLFSDSGFNGLVVNVKIVGIEKEGSSIRVGAGEDLSSVLNYCIDHSLSGLEWAGGLPGTVGGAVRGNAGAYTGETKDNILSVETFDVNTLEYKKRNRQECKFEYRNSIFKSELEGIEIITYVTFEMQEGDRSNIKELVEDKINKRKLRHPLDFPNLGSIFKNIPTEKFSKEKLKELEQYIKNDPFPVIPTAKINYLAGLSGVKVGDAQLSTKHTNFIINLGNANAKDVKDLIAIIKKTVFDKYQVELEEEISYLN